MKRVKLRGMALCSINEGDLGLVQYELFQP